MSRHGRCRLRLEPSRGGTVGCLSLAPQAPWGGQCRSVTPKDEVGSVGLGAGPKPGTAGGRIQEVWLRSQKVRGCQGQGAALPAPRRSLEGREPHTLHPRCLGGPTAWHPPQSTAGSLYGGQANTALGWAHLRGPASMDWRRLLSPAHTCRSPLHSGVCGESRGAPS